LTVFLRTRYANLMWNSARLAGEHRFESTLSAGHVLWLYLGNLVAILCTLGLATPWAKVRLARYRAQSFELIARGGIDGFVAGADADRGAAGAELSHALDLGVDIGILTPSKANGTTAVPAARAGCGWSWPTRARCGSWTWRRGRSRSGRSPKPPSARAW